MNPARLPGRTPAAAPEPLVEPIPVPPVPEPVVTPIPRPVPAPAAPPAQGEPFTGLDPLTRSLIEAAPLVADRPALPRTTPTSPPTQLDSAPPARRFRLKQPAFLVALGGTLAAGLLVLTGAVKQRRLGHPTAPAGQAIVAAAPGPALPSPVSAPAPSSWLVAGGH